MALDFGCSVPYALDPRIPVDLETIVRKAMAHEPEQRYATAEALAADLRAYLDGRPIAARTPERGVRGRLGGWGLKRCAGRSPRARRSTGPGAV